MKYRAFGNTGLKPSILGFGMMRMKRDENGKYDEKWTVDTLRYAIDNGLSYVDTAYAYGDSERITGVALRDGYREKVTLASKMPVGMMKCEEDFDRILNEQLERLQTDHIDVYLLHALNRNTWDQKVIPFNVLQKAEKAKAEGKIKHLGFSFHDNLDAFRYILNAYDKWEFCQIQLNYMDVNYQAGITGLEEAYAKGLAVVIMEPLRGGRLAEVPEAIAKLLPGNPVESALDFLWNRKEVSVVLSGMSEFSQVEQNLLYADRASIGMLTEKQVADMTAAGDQMRKLVSIPCTGCDYCNICPQEIPIPKIFALWNQRQLDGDGRKAKKTYLALGDRLADKCVQCGACVEKCPQNIEIFKHLDEIRDWFE